MPVGRLSETYKTLLERCPAYHDGMILVDQETEKVTHWSCKLYTRSLPEGEYPLDGGTFDATGLELSVEDNVTTYKINHEGVIRYRDKKRERILAKDSPQSFQQLLVA